MTDKSDWSGSVGDVWAAEWRRTDRSFADLSPRLDAAILAAAPDCPFRALDVGCGAGGTSLALARARTDASIVGIDLSNDLIAAAKARFAEAGDTVARRAELIVGDAPNTAQAHAPFDLIYSRHGVMFFDDPVAAFAALHRAARTDGALVFSCFADWSDNAFARAIAEAIGTGTPSLVAPGPFAFADRDRVARLLIESGWRDPSPRRVPFHYRAGTGPDPVGDALSFFQRIGPAAAALRTADERTRAVLIDRVATVVAAHCRDGAVDFPACAWIWSARA